MKKLLPIMLTAIAFGLVMPIAHADDTAITLTSYEDLTNGSWSLGAEFSPTVNIDVTSLGSFFVAGATDEQGVSIWNSSDDLLVSTTITGDDSATDGFQFESITPIELVAGETYYMSAYTGGNAFAVADNGIAGAPGDGFTVGPDITYLAHVEAPCGGTAACFPSNNLGEEFADFGADFTYTAATATATPEPGTLLLLGSGLVGLAGMVRRRFARR